MFYWHHSYHSSLTTPLYFLLPFVFLGTKSFFKNRLRELVPPLIASIITKFENQKRFTKTGTHDHESPRELERRENEAQRIWRIKRRSN